MFQDGSDKTISSASLGKGGESARQTPDPLRANFSLGRSPHPRYWAPKGAYHPQAVFLDPGPTLTSKAETPTARAAEQQRNAEPKQRRTEATEHRTHEARKQRPGARKNKEKETQGFKFTHQNEPEMPSEQLPKCFEGPEHCSSGSGGVSGRSREVSGRLLGPPGAPSGASWGAPGASRRPFREYFWTSE